jgi:hypothetical protein
MRLLRPNGKGVAYDGAGSNQQLISHLPCPTSCPIDIACPCLWLNEQSSIRIMAESAIAPSQAQVTRLVGGQPVTGS